MQVRYKQHLVSHTRRSNLICASVMRHELILQHGPQSILTLHLLSCPKKSYRYPQHNHCPHYHEPPAKTSCLRSMTRNMQHWWCCCCPGFGRQTLNRPRREIRISCDHYKCSEYTDVRAWSVLYVNETRERGERAANEQDSEGMSLQYWEHP